MSSSHYTPRPEIRACGYEPYVHELSSRRQAHGEYRPCCQIGGFCCGYFLVSEFTVEQRCGFPKTKHWTWHIVECRDVSEEEIGYGLIWHINVTCAWGLEGESRRLLRKSTYVLWFETRDFWFKAVLLRLRLSQCVSRRSFIAKRQKTCLKINKVDLFIQTTGLCNPQELAASFSWCFGERQENINLPLINWLITSIIQITWDAELPIQEQLPVYTMSLQEGWIFNTAQRTSNVASAPLDITSHHRHCSWWSSW